MMYCQYTKLSVLILLWLILHNCQYVSGITRMEVFPFGQQVGDKELPVGNYASKAVPLQMSIQTFGSRTSQIKIHSDGWLEFQDGNTSLSTASVHIYPTEMIREVGQVFYRETADPDLLQEGGSLLQPIFPDFSNPLTRLLITTWYYGANYNLKQSVFQCVLGTDGSHTFAMLLYTEELKDWTSVQEESAPARIGFLTSYGFKSVFLPRSGHGPSVGSITDTGNLGIPGLWVFQINEDDLKMPTVNECELKFDTCDPNAVCTDTPGGFSCACNPGFTGDGVLCLIETDNNRRNALEGSGGTSGSAGFSGLTVGFQQSIYSVNEGAGPVIVCVEKKGPEYLEGSVHLVITSSSCGLASEGSDFTAVDGHVDLGINQAQLCTQVAINDDIIPEAQESFCLTLATSDPTVSLDPANATVIIHDDDDNNGTSSSNGDSPVIVASTNSQQSSSRTHSTALPTSASTVLGIQTLQTSFLQPSDVTPSTVVLSITGTLPTLPLQVSTAETPVLETSIPPSLQTLLSELPQSASRPVHGTTSFESLPLQTSYLAESNITTMPLHTTSISGPLPTDIEFTTIDDESSSSVQIDPSVGGIIGGIALLLIVSVTVCIVITVFVGRRRKRKSSALADEPCDTSCHTVSNQTAREVAGIGEDLYHRQSTHIYDYPMAPLRIEGAISNPVAFSSSEKSQAGGHVIAGVGHGNSENIYADTEDYDPKQYYSVIPITPNISYHNQHFWNEDQENDNGSIL